MPQSWNRYVYTLGDPVNLNDPTGLVTACDLATRKILGAMESPGHWITVSRAGEIFIGSLNGNLFRWYGGWRDRGLDPAEGLKPPNQR